MIHHQLWPTGANLGRRALSLISPEKCQRDTIFGRN